MDERQKRIGRAIEGKWSELRSEREKCGWGRKLEACGYFHHRDMYGGTEVGVRKKYESTPRGYMVKFVSGLCGYLMPEDGIWGKLVAPSSVGAKERTVSTVGVEKSMLRDLEWLTGVGFEAMADSGYYQSILEMEMDRECFGHGYLWVVDGWDAGDSGVGYMCIDPQECVMSDSYFGKLEVFIRRFEKSATDLVRRFPNSRLERCRQSVKAGGGDGRKFAVYEAVVPRDYFWDAESGERMALGNGKRFAHLVWVEGESELVEESGYDAMPVFQSRRFGDSEKMPYGVGLAEDVLEDVKRLNDLANQRQIIVQRNANPAMYAPTALQGRFSGKPGSVMYGPDVSQAPRPILQNIGGDSILHDIESVKQGLRNLIPVDLFETLMGGTDSRKTATEVQMKKNEAMVLLSFQIGAMKRDVLEPMFKRTVKIALKHMSASDLASRDREGLAKLVDDSRFELSSVFVQRLSAYLQTSANDEVLMSLQGLMQIYPQASDALRMDEWIQHYFRGKGLMESLIASKQEMDEKRKQRAEVQKAQLESQLNAENAKANAENAKASSMQMRR